MFKVFLTNLGKYNEGELVGKWVDLPCDDWQEELLAIGVDGVNYEEYFCSDFDHDYEFSLSENLSEYMNLTALNELAEELEGLSDSEKEHLTAYIEANGGTLEDALECFKNSVLYTECKTLEDLAYQFVNESEEFQKCPNWIKNNFNYKAYATDLGYMGYVETSAGVLY